ncbi:PREDICTED: kinesin-like protein KIF13A isoform X3 [Branchiostoma belcheri]|uniref:Kinesin-like protein KIF13A isoform X3 n=1 Tax=Branchiostoma belcheri TaxID=7741 RepID=A0A6P4YTI1_BRABE|nr:PREDICTED: kinesin-like protein KIF13A isoform X3 [Branchiostoma belcheri]
MGEPTSNVKVAVRVRPMNRRELGLATKCVVDMEGNQTILAHPTTKPGERKPPKTFAFDYCFWSMDETNTEKFSSQETVFKCVGADILENAFQGYNACIFAYGQTGSGKSYTMMGAADNGGLIPRLCVTLFDSIVSKSNEILSFKVEVSYMEIYNEKVRDLLDPGTTKHNLKVREHKILGPYVDGLQVLAVTKYEDIEKLMNEGNKSRTVAATSMNEESSRSHAVFNIIVTQTLKDLASGVTGEKVSKVSLVDLAGSERAAKTGAAGERLKEGSNINKSLSTLGLVISTLADQSAGKGAKNKFVPYRDSVLTWLLKDNLGGNSKTAMIATISPALDNYEETLSTLRYADRAKRIVNHAVVNEDPNARIIRELREEVDKLKVQLTEAESLKAPDLKERLLESEKLMKDMTTTWEEKLAKTEKLHQERQQALEKMGISVQTSGIKVEQDKNFLVNLNADPSLNELLVYYLKDHTLVGRPDAPTPQDIQLSGLGIQPEHCIIDLEGEDVYITPMPEARCCVNGDCVTQKTLLRNGNRIFLGNHHFFRINCPRSGVGSVASTPDVEVSRADYDFAQNEVMMVELMNDPIQNAMKSLESQHEKDKEGALEKQREMYEKKLEVLRQQLSSPVQNKQAVESFGGLSHAVSNPNLHPRYTQWVEERDELFRQGLAKLREEIVKANALVREANSLAQELEKMTEFHVTLQIPASNLSPNRKRGIIISEPAIQVKRKGRSTQVWSMEKLENRIIDMRDYYQEVMEQGREIQDMEDREDPFYESQENHNLIGVANVFLECLYHDIRFEYAVPIISQQGEASGRLHVEVVKVAGTVPDRLQADAHSDGSSSESHSSFEIIDPEGEGAPLGGPLTFRLKILEATDLPPSLSHFVFCQYTFWGHPSSVVVPPVINPELPSYRSVKGTTMRFEHSREFTVNVSEEFMDFLENGAWSIEVWGHRSAGFDSTKPGWEVDHVSQKAKSLRDRWGELIRKIELWVEIQELNEQGEYTPVELQVKPEVLTGGVFQLRQGHSRRIQVKVKPVHNSGTLPIICESITSIAVGCVAARSKLQKGLDSYQEDDLTLLRERWSEALMRRRDYLDKQIQQMINKEYKSDNDKEREGSLIDQWVCLTEERNAVLVPAPNSGIPGAPADWSPPHGMEIHIPVLFLDLNADDMSTPGLREGPQAAGVNSILPKEHGTKLFNLPIIKYMEKDELEVCAVASWDSSIHDSINLNRITPSNERVYLITKVTVRLSHPASMELVLRKRICVNIYKKQGFMASLKKNLDIGQKDMVTACGITYEVVSNIPKASEEIEDRETLAMMAVSGVDNETTEGESYIEKYTKGVSAVESILALDRLRQEVAVKETLAAIGRPLRKVASVPNIQQAMSRLESPGSRDEEYGSPRSESHGDISSSLPLQLTENHSLPNQHYLHKDMFRPRVKESSRDSLGSPDYPLGSPVGVFPFGSPKAASPITKFSKPLRPVLEELNKELTPLLDKEKDDIPQEDEKTPLATEDGAFRFTTSAPVQIPVPKESSLDAPRGSRFEDEEISLSPIFIRVPFQEPSPQDQSADREKRISLLLDEPIASSPLRIRGEMAPRASAAQLSRQPPPHHSSSSSSSSDSSSSNSTEEGSLSDPTSPTMFLNLHADVQSPPKSKRGLRHMDEKDNSAVETEIQLEEEVDVRQTSDLDVHEEDTGSSDSSDSSNSTDSLDTSDDEDENETMATHSINIPASSSSSHRNPRQHEENHREEDFAEFEAYNPTKDLDMSFEVPDQEESAASPPLEQVAKTDLVTPVSDASDDLQRGSTRSVTSSGYGSQAASNLTLADEAILNDGVNGQKGKDVSTDLEDAAAKISDDKRDTSDSDFDEDSLTHDGDASQSEVSPRLQRPNTLLLDSSCKPERTDQESGPAVAEDVDVSEPTLDDDTNVVIQPENDDNGEQERTEHTEADPNASSSEGLQTLTATDTQVLEGNAQEAEKLKSLEDNKNEDDEITASQPSEALIAGEDSLESSEPLTPYQPEPTVVEEQLVEFQESVSETKLQGGPSEVQEEPTELPEEDSEAPSAELKEQLLEEERIHDGMPNEEASTEKPNDFHHEEANTQDTSTVVLNDAHPSISLEAPEKSEELAESTNDASNITEATAQAAKDELPDQTLYKVDSGYYSPTNTLTRGKTKEEEEDVTPTEQTNAFFEEEGDLSISSQEVPSSETEDGEKTPTLESLSPHTENSGPSTACVHASYESEEVDEESNTSADMSCEEQRIEDIPKALEPPQLVVPETENDEELAERTEDPEGESNSALLNAAETSTPDNLSDADDNLSVCSVDSRPDSRRGSVIEVPPWLGVGEYVDVGRDKHGVVKFVGETEFASGPWVGVELDMDAGRNDGEVKGVRYFKCRPNYGIFVRPDKVTQASRRRSTRSRPSPSSSKSTSSKGTSSQVGTSPGQKSSQRVSGSNTLPRTKRKEKTNS